MSYRVSEKYAIGSVSPKNSIHFKLTMTMYPRITNIVTEQPQYVLKYAWPL